MVLAAAACCGSMPLSASHSGLAEVNELLAPAVSADLRLHLSFELGPGAVREIADKLAWWLSFIERTPKAANGAAGRGGSFRGQPLRIIASAGALIGASAFSSACPPVLIQPPRRASHWLSLLLPLCWNEACTVRVCR